MPCYYPLSGWRSRVRNPSGKRNIVFNKSEGFSDMPLSVPCGQCIGCRLERSKQWAIRCAHEASLYQDNSFITLTYADEFLPKNGSLVKADFQKFMKRLRFRHGEGIRYYYCGEYGENFGRPHYHACLFNFDFRDKRLAPIRQKSSSPVFVSDDLKELWPYGFSTVGNVTFESAAYVARYITKKVTGKRALDHYTKFDLNTGEVISERLPEYTDMSRRYAIGKGWFEKFYSDVFPEDFVVLNGKKMKVPKYYDAQFELAYPSDFEIIKAKRRKAAIDNADKNTLERLQTLEFIQRRRFEKLIRSYENGL